MIYQDIIPYSPQYFFILAFTVVLLVVKLFLIIYLTKRILNKKKEGEPITLNFTTGVLVLMIVFFISRILYAIFDFILTEFDTNRYTYPPNIEIWKIASFIICLGPIPMLYFIDKNIFHFATKKIPEILVIISGIIMLVWPVAPGDTRAFEIDSSIGFVAGIGLFMIPVAFIVIIRKTTGDIRKNATLIVVALMIYVIGGIFVNEGVISLLHAEDLRVVMHFLATTLKSAGLILFTYVAMRFHLQ